MENNDMNIFNFNIDNSVELLISEVEAYRRWGIGAFNEEQMHLHNFENVDFKEKINEDTVKLNL